MSAKPGSDMPSAPASPPAGEQTLKLVLPGGEVAAQQLLPVVHQLAEHFIGSAAAAAERNGKTISCRAGCGACCRQAVPLADIEAWALADVIEAMPQERRAEIHARFAAAERTLDDAGMGSLEVDGESTEVKTRLSKAYFALSLACPFLENESCSIHPSRPLACREYLVTSPPELCRTVGDSRVESLRIARLDDALLRLTSEDTPPRPRTILMPLLFRWLAGNPRPTATKPAQRWIARLLSIQSSMGKRDGGAAKP